MSVPSAVKRLILELGLRYRPQASDQLEAYQAKLAALMQDCSDVPAEYLERAIREWATQSPYLPKASDLIGKAQGYLRRPSAAPGAEDLQALAARRNATNTRPDLEWVVEGGDLKLVSRSNPMPRFSRELTMNPAEITAYAKKQQDSIRRALPIKDAA